MKLREMKERGDHQKCLNRSPCMQADEISKRLLLSLTSSTKCLVSMGPSSRGYSASNSRPGAFAFVEKLGGSTYSGKPCKKKCVTQQRESHDKKCALLLLVGTVLSALVGAPRAVEKKPNNTVVSHLAVGKFNCRQYVCIYKSALSEAEADASAEISKNAPKTRR